MFPWIRNGFFIKMTKNYNWYKRERLKYVWTTLCVHRLLEYFPQECEWETSLYLEVRHLQLNIYILVTQKDSLTTHRPPDYLTTFRSNRSATAYSPQFLKTSEGIPYHHSFFSNLRSVISLRLTNFCFLPFPQEWHLTPMHLRLSRMGLSTESIPLSSDLSGSAATVHKWMSHGRSAFLRPA